MSNCNMSRPQNVRPQCVQTAKCPTAICPDRKMSQPQNVPNRRLSIFPQSVSPQDVKTAIVLDRGSATATWDPAVYYVFAILHFQQPKLSWSKGHAQGIESCNLQGFHRKKTCILSDDFRHIRVYAMLEITFITTLFYLTYVHDNLFKRVSWFLVLTPWSGFYLSSLSTGP